MMEFDIIAEFIGDMQSNEKINVQSNDELVDKIKTLNNLLSDKLITKDEFEARKKALLDSYVNKN